jgi:hypothetical protein
MGGSFAALFLCNSFKLGVRVSRQIDCGKSGIDEFAVTGRQPNKSDALGEVHPCLIS